MTEDTPPTTDHVFLGYFLPSDWWLSLADTQFNPIADDDWATPFRMSAIAANGILTIRCSVPSQWSVIDAKNRCEQALRLYASPFAFRDRSSLDLRITATVGPGSHSIFTGHFPGLTPARVDVPRLQALIAHHPELSRVLTEFFMGIGSSLDTALHCFRGLEQLRAIVVGKEPSAGAWVEFNRRLRTSEAFFAPLTDLSETTRHGRLLHVTEDERRRCLETLAEAVERSAVWLERGLNDPLPAEEFPQL